MLKCLLVFSNSKWSKLTHFLSMLTFIFLFVEIRKPAAILFFFLKINMSLASFLIHCSYFMYSFWFRYSTDALSLPLLQLCLKIQHSFLYHQSKNFSRTVLDNILCSFCTSLFLSWNTTVISLFMWKTSYFSFLCILLFWPTDLYIHLPAWNGGLDILQASEASVLNMALSLVVLSTTDTNIHQSL